MEKIFINKENSKTDSDINFCLKALRQPSQKQPISAISTYTF